MRRAAAVALVAIVASGCTSTPIGGGSAATTVALPPSVAAELADLDVAEPQQNLPDYRRAAFGDDWDYDPVSGCNTRERVLIAESLKEPTMGERCKPLAGEWRSAYDGAVVTDPARLQIDHLVPLADAWRSGAWRWDDERRTAFANDLADPGTLVAVTGASNQSKGDSTPDRWLPPNEGAWCSYARDWVRVKVRWGLTATPAEHRRLGEVLAGC